MVNRRTPPGEKFLAIGPGAQAFLPGATDELLRASRLNLRSQ